MRMKSQMTMATVALAMILAGCNSYNVYPVKYDPEMTRVTVIQNPKVIVSDFLNVMEEEFSTRGIPIKVENAGYVGKDGEYTVTYDARQSWAFAAYLADANVRIRKDNLLMGQGHYHHRGGSLSLSVWKWQGTRKKMRPLYEELLQAWDKKE